MERIPSPCLPGLSVPGSSDDPGGDVSLDGEEEKEALETLPGAMAQAAAGLMLTRRPASKPRALNTAH